MTTLERIKSYNIEFDSKEIEPYTEYIEYIDLKKNIDFGIKEIELYTSSIKNFKKLSNFQNYLLYLNFNTLRLNVLVLKFDISDNLHYLKKYPEILKKERKYWNDYCNKIFDKYDEIQKSLQNKGL